MRSNRACSKPQAELVRLFVERSGVGSPHKSAEQVMEDLVEKARGSRTRSREGFLQRFLDSRHIISIDFADDLNCDGMIQPIGSTFTSGFRIRLKKNVSDARTRFTMAHEACHTFFYEFAPEMKFRPHETDESEERLCNFGAAVLLIPSASLRARTKELPICLDSLEQLAREYAVSLPTMLLRLRALRLWGCELSSWYRTTGGGFVLDRLYGGHRAEWKWQDPSMLARVWNSNESAFGTGFLYVEHENGTRAYRPIPYNIQRSGAGLVALWGAGIRPVTPRQPLFEATTLRRA